MAAIGQGPYDHGLRGNQDIAEPVAELAGQYCRLPVQAHQFLPILTFSLAHFLFEDHF